jgi:hypothetical protein
MRRSVSERVDAKYARINKLGQFVAIEEVRVQGASIAVAWYNQLGFHQTSVHRFEAGLTDFVTVERGPFFANGHAPIFGRTLK